MVAPKKVYAETSEHKPGTYYGVATNMTPGNPGAQTEILACTAGREAAEEAPFDGSRYALVLRGLSRLKAEAIVMILNAPED